MISGASNKVQDDMLQTQENKAKLAADAAAKTNASVVDAAKDAAKQADASMSDVSENIRTVKEVQKQLSDKKFDLPGAIADIKSKLVGVDFDFLNQDQINKLDSAAKNISKFGDILTGVQSSMEILSNFPKLMQQATTAIKGDAIKPAIEAVDKMVQMVRQLDDALANGDLNKINVTTNLKKVATSLGLGSKANYTIKNKDVVINLDLKVVMDVDKLERVIVLRKSSIIRERLQYGTVGDGAAKPGYPDLPESYTEAPVTAMQAK